MSSNGTPRSASASTRRATSTASRPSPGAENRATESSSRPRGGAAANGAAAGAPVRAASRPVGAASACRCRRRDRSGAGPAARAPRAMVARRQSQGNARRAANQCRHEALLETCPMATSSRTTSVPGRSRRPPPPRRPRSTARPASPSLPGSPPPARGRAARRDRHRLIQGAQALRIGAGHLQLVQRADRRPRKPGRVGHRREVAERPVTDGGESSPRDHGLGANGAGRRRLPARERGSADITSSTRLVRSRRTGRRGPRLRWRRTRRRRRVTARRADRASARRRQGRPDGVEPARGGGGDDGVAVRHGQRGYNGGRVKPGHGER